MGRAKERGTFGQRSDAAIRRGMLRRKRRNRFDCLCWAVASVVVVLAFVGLVVA